MTNPVRRVVTGHTAAGKAVVLADGEPPLVIRSPVQPGLAFHEIWNTTAMPQLVAATFDEPTTKHAGTTPPKGGTVIRIVDLPPEGPDETAIRQGPVARAVLRRRPRRERRAARPGRHPLMHRTESIDYGIVLSGEIVMLLDDTEVLLRAGDVVVQRGTVHAWTNRTREICRMAFILTDGAFEPDWRKGWPSTIRAWRPNERGDAHAGDAVVPPRRPLRAGDGGGPRPRPRLCRRTCRGGCRGDTRGAHGKRDRGGRRRPAPTRPFGGSARRRRHRRRRLRRGDRRRTRPRHPRQQRRHQQAGPVHRRDCGELRPGHGAERPRRLLRQPGLRAAAQGEGRRGVILNMSSQMGHVGAPTAPSTAPASTRWKG